MTVGVAAFRPPSQQDIQDMVDLARNERADALGTIIGQKDEFISYFMGLLTATGESQPEMHALLHSASLVGHYFCMYFKGIFAAPRPSAYYPPLMPPIEVPGHPSYPSGHATQSKLMALCLKARLGIGFDAATGNTTNGDVYGLALDALAGRVARNRQIGGLHTQNDTDAGITLALALFRMLQDMDVAWLKPPQRAAAR